MREYYHGPLFDMGDAPGQRQGSGRRAEGAWRGGDCRSYVGLACPPTLLTLPGHRFPSASRAQWRQRLGSHSLTILSTGQRRNTKEGLAALQQARPRAPRAPRAPRVLAPPRRRRAPQASSAATVYGQRREARWRCVCVCVQAINYMTRQAQPAPPLSANRALCRAASLVLKRGATGAMAARAWMRPKGRAATRGTWCCVRLLLSSLPRAPRSPRILNFACASAGGGRSEISSAAVQRIGR